MMNPAHEMNFTALVGSGESYDVLYTADDKRLIYADYIFCGKAGFQSLMQQLADATAQSKVQGTFMEPFPGATDLWANIVLQTGLGRGAFRTRRAPQTVWGRTYERLSAVGRCPHSP